MKAEKIDQMIKALTKLKEAHSDIIDLWHMDDIDLNVTESINDYPFHLSFDELNISEWVLNTINELKGLL